jgi:hypothetical protein
MKIKVIDFDIQVTSQLQNTVYREGSEYKGEVLTKKKTLYRTHAVVISHTKLTVSSSERLFVGDGICTDQMEQFRVTSANENTAEMYSLGSSGKSFNLRSEFEATVISSSMPEGKY